ncbi:hypothetical protein [Paraferrimonas sedimenticola]|uniref:Uncharacterized protein n=1 Tax=Paraferrimonas sedimenticola TaxID=375674 RepID=A0AA37RTD1_9GAMM|nr:hypothetical protein [Paraferrimonas sedimenticola]GLP95281.1 hypothetical protein GCM10007895_05870 [Paraferrimonas sedimenticola]
MALLFMDGLDDYSGSSATATTQMLNSGKWTSVFSNQDVTALGAGAIGSAFRLVSCQTQKMTMSGNKLIINCWLKRTGHDLSISTAHYQRIFEVWNGADTPLITLATDFADVAVREFKFSLGAMDDGNPKLNTNPIALVIDEIDHYCFEIELATTATGSIKVYRNGVVIDDTSGIITADAALDGQVSVRWGGYSNSSYSDSVDFDHLAIMDGSGSKHNGYAGVLRVVPLYPNSDDTIAASSTASSGGLHHDDVDDTTWDLTPSTHVEIATVGHENLYGLEDGSTAWTDAGTVLAVEICQSVAGEVPLTTNVQSLIHDGTNTDYSPNFETTVADYNIHSHIFVDAPDGGDWDLTELDGLRIGHKLVSSV